ncbi:hypothetical protein METBIDRAFT_9751 [Metschnikowia bicuspidata var. bicuspidata NRRL YB-4993]|uniref:Hyphally-regulated cell wall protein N-terminal domain-containing protein n=1 Tax=Metschnikowia bicuspidata var. bicuspidata NRRL YB-4993 TaxID=869754 RepID=A0A1A0HHY5_9ASCO|nr:hypothetical protein METBIDRAFT_9751 [Metschnikowia bicuspidata var. bicuspidata NRRL YB-4993]OBA23492.1 hypothetical protein METBIDRAFT_9751 [Metschnikowia bicuspidata var. bicuspidata NRRL YB-4993]
MYFGIHGSDLLVYSFNIFSEQQWINSGTMVFQGVYGRKVPVKIKGNSENRPLITNLGKICLNNAMWRTHMGIEGIGCINVGPYSRLNFVFDESQIRNRQTIVLDSYSELRISKLDLASSVPYIKVVGLGESNGVTVDVRIESDKIDYSKDTGLLTLKKSGQDMIRLRIGRGYDENRFNVTYNYFGSTLVYKHAAPTLSYEICSCDSKFPDTPKVPAYESC